MQLFTHCRAHQMYNLFGFILVAFLVLCITSAEVASLLTYFQLCGEVRMGPISEAETDLGLLLKI